MYDEAEAPITGGNKIFYIGMIDRIVNIICMIYTSQITTWQRLLQCALKTLNMQDRVISV